MCQNYPTYEILIWSKFLQTKYRADHSPSKVGSFGRSIGASSEKERQWVMLPQNLSKTKSITSRKLEIRQEQTVGYKGKKIPYAQMNGIKDNLEEKKKKKWKKKKVLRREDNKLFALSSLSLLSSPSSCSLSLSNLWAL